MKYSRLKSKTKKSVKIELEIPLGKSMLQSEEIIRESLNEAGVLAEEVVLETFDTDGSPIITGDIKLTSRGQFRKVYQTPWGEAEVMRHVYQSSKGGRQYCPLEKGARIVLTSTPGFAKMVSWKYAELGSSRVLEDLEQNHDRTIARSYLKKLCDTVGAIAQEKEEFWSYAPPELDEKVSSVSLGIDGTCMLLVEDGWREAMVGTISLYGRKGNRLHTIQMGATPEYGKESFYSRFENEVDQVKRRWPKATYVGVADGAKSNWDYLTSMTDKQTIDFWHASGYLGRAAEAMYTGKKQSIERKEWLEDSCHKLKHNVGAATRLLNTMTSYEKSHRLKGIQKDNLNAAITYFKNNKLKMKYAQNLNDNLPLGSGVTEAACKTLIKQRLCNSGMRWKEEGAAAVLSLRSLTHTDCRWEQFWNKVDQYGVSLAA